MGEDLSNKSIITMIFFVTTHFIFYAVYSFLISKKKKKQHADFISFYCLLRTPVLRQSGSLFLETSTSRLYFCLQLRLVRNVVSWTLLVQAALRIQAVQRLLMGTFQKWCFSKQSEWVKQQNVGKQKIEDVCSGTFGAMPHFKTWQERAAKTLILQFISV